MGLKVNTKAFLVFVWLLKRNASYLNKYLEALLKKIVKFTV